MWLHCPQNWLQWLYIREGFGLARVDKLVLAKRKQDKNWETHYFDSFCDVAFYKFPWKQFGVWYLMLSKYVAVFVAFWEKTCNHHDLFNAPQWDLTVLINHNSSYSILIDFGGIRAFPKGIKPRECFVSFPSPLSQFITTLLSPLMTSHGR